MPNQTVCHYNKFGFCKFGKDCFRYHENKVCENDSCQVLECNLRHPRKCHWYSDFKYCKFGSYCKFSHKPNVEGKAIENIEKELKNIENQINEKEKEIIKINEIIKKMEKSRSDIDILSHKDEAIREEVKFLKEENKSIKSRFIVMENEIEALKSKLDYRDHVQDDVTEKDEVTEKEAVTKKDEVTEKDKETDCSENKSPIKCEKCEFVAKSEAGLKTHITVKHKTSMFKAYTKISR